MYKDLEDKELTVICKMYDASIVKVKKVECLELFEVYYEDRFPLLKDISYLDTFVNELKQNYRDMRLSFILK